MRRVALLLFVCLTACGKPPEPELQAKGGAEIYAKLCASCHAPDGRSLATLAPPLAGHAVRLLEAGSRGHLIRIVLNGMTGPIEVTGRRYESIMTPLRYLKDEQVADVLNHVLTSWGNDALLAQDFTPITPQEVRKEREHVLSPRQVAAERPRLEASPAEEIHP